jgi:glycosyltransferase involved in cell wall biosynthesis
VSRKKIAFVKIGSFSHVNREVVSILSRHFPGCDLEVLDVQDDLSVRDREAANLLAAAGNYGADILLGRKKLAQCLLRTPRYFRNVRKAAAKRIVPGEYAFSFQTQSLFDAGREGVPHYVYTDHTHLALLDYPDFDRKKHLFSESWIDLEKSIYGNARIVFATSGYAARSLVKHYSCPPERVRCVYSGINVESGFTPGSGRADRGKNILFVGIGWDIKGGPDLVEAFRLVRESHPDAGLTIVGSSPRLRLPNCEVVGKVSPERLREYYRKASVFCLPSRMDRSPVAVVEASAWGLPVVSTLIGGIPDRVLEGKTGYLVRPGDVPALAAALTRLLDDPGAAEAMGEAGCRFVGERFSWEKVGTLIHEAISSSL